MGRDVLMTVLWRGVWYILQRVLTCDSIYSGIEKCFASRSNPDVLNWPRPDAILGFILARFLLSERKYISTLLDHHYIPKGTAVVRRARLTVSCTRRRLPWPARSSLSWMPSLSLISGR